MSTVNPLVGQLFSVGFEGLVAPDYILEWLQQGKIGGIILFSRNVANPEQLARLTQSLHEAASHPIFIAIDQEGGTVARLRDGFTEAPSALGLSNSNNPDHVATSYRILAQELRQLGINWNYAPVVDITYNRENPTVGTRSFGTTASRVARFAREVVRGLQDNGVIACAKHFPGLGNTAVDTHVALATLDVSYEHLLENDLVPYRALIEAGVASIMTTHTRFTVLDDTHPATLSPFIVPRLLRQELGYDGYITTDCLEMKAISNNYGAGESAVLAVLASIDNLLVSHTRPAQEQAYEAVLEALNSGRITEAMLSESLRRRQYLLAQFAITHTPSTEGIRQPENLATMRLIARDSISLIGEHTKIDLHQPHVAFIEFVSALDSEVMEQGGQSGIRKCFFNEGYSSPMVSLKPYGQDPQFENALMLAKRAQTTVIATRNAHLLPEQAQRASQLAEASQTVIHLCLRNPYDDTLLNVDSVLCSFGDSEPSLLAILDALTGIFVPQAGFSFEGE